MKPRRFLWITDPWDTLDHGRDTSLRLAHEAMVLGHESWWCDVKSLRWDKSRILLDAARMHPLKEFGMKPRLAPPRARSPLDFDSLQYRVDPPVDLAYLQPLQLLRIALQMGPKRLPELVNPLSVLFLANEKLEGLLLGEFAPVTLAAARWESLFQFGAAEGKTVMKPLHLAQSRGIELLDWTSKPGLERARACLAEATGGFERPVLLQRYLAGIAQGETRLWFLDGRVLACARKLPLENDFRVNIDRGSQLTAHVLTAREKKAAAAIGKRLRTLKIRLAAIDLIDNFVTDFNFTSPGLITQMERTTGRNLAKPIIEALAKSQ